MNSPAADFSNCATVSCFNATAWTVVNGFAAFGRILRETPVPPGSAAIEKRLIADTAGSEESWRGQAVATSFTGIENAAAAGEKVGGQWDSDYPALISSLGSELTALGNKAVTLDNATTTLNQEGAALIRQAEALHVTISVQAASPGS